MGAICKSTKSPFVNTMTNLETIKNPSKTTVRSDTNILIKNSRTINIETEKDIALTSNVLVALQTGLPLDNYNLEKKLGAGSYGTVFRVRHKDINIIRAMKKIERPKEETNIAKIKDKEIINEIELLKTMDHPNIVKIFEFYSTKEAYYLITEHCNNGELFEKIRQFAPFKEEDAAYIMYQILSAVYYCHDNLKIIHRDLKPENILIDSEESKRKFNIKIIDFGTAKCFKKNVNESRLIGSAYYIAPEVLKKEYNEKCDLWSCGVILYILLSGRPPFGGEDDEIMKKIKIGKYDLSRPPLNDLSSECKDLIKRLLTMNPEERPSAKLCLKHIWFKNHNVKEMINHVKYEKLRESINNLKEYKSEGKLKDMALAFLIHNSLHLPEIKELYKVFRNIDKNGDGKITKKEMSYCLEKYYGIPNCNLEEEVNEIFNNVDNDNNNNIEYEEFIRACCNKDKLLSDENLQFTFNFFDKDRSGDITIDELMKVFCKGKNKNIENDMIKDMMKEIDKNGDSSIDFKEFKIMMKGIIKSNKSK